MPGAEASTFGRWAMPRGHLAPRVAKEVRKSFKWRRLPSSLGSGAEVLGVYLPVQVLPDKVAYDREDHHEGRLADAYQSDQEDYESRDQSAPLLVGPGGHLFSLSLRSGSLYRDFDVFDGDALVPQHSPDVLSGARREIGVVARRGDLY